MKVDEGYMKIFNSCQEFEREGSGWDIEEVLHLKLLMGTYKPLKGSKSFKVPEKIHSNAGILNIDNKDEKCFLWCILAALHQAKQNVCRVNNYKQYEGELNMKGITYPLAVKQVPKFEKQNTISVNVFGFKDEYYPLYISPEQKEIHVNLLLIYDNEKSHYCLIKNLDKMLSSRTKYNRRTYYCTYCLHGFSEEGPLLKHEPMCNNHGLQHTELPDEENKWMKFANIKKMLKVPYVIYADFECILEPSTKKNTISQHKACGYSYLVVSSVDQEKQQAVVYRGDDAAQHFLKSITKEVDKLRKHMKEIYIPIIMTQEDEINFQQATKCFICEEELEKDRVQDHCHLTGKYGGAAHFNCNLQFQYPNAVFGAWRVMGLHGSVFPVILFLHSQYRCTVLRCQNP